MLAAFHQPQEALMYKRILVPLDGSDTARRGLVEAVGLARALGAQLHLLHVVADLEWLVEMASVASNAKLHEEMQRYGEELLTSAAGYVAAQGVAAETTLREAAGVASAKVIVDEAVTADCDAIVMGTHGRKGVSRLLLGSDASLVASTSPVPVLLVRPGDAKD
jgi:nucleotide-binding universal stress UspA family protein